MIGIRKVIGRTAMSSRELLVSQEFRNAIKNWRLFWQDGTSQADAGSGSASAGSRKEQWKKTFAEIMFGEQRNTPEKIEMATRAIELSIPTAKPTSLTTAASKAAFQPVPSDPMAIPPVKLRQSGGPEAIKPSIPTATIVEPTKPTIADTKLPELVMPLCRQPNVRLDSGIQTRPLLREGQRTRLSNEVESTPSKAVSPVVPTKTNQTKSSVLSSIPGPMKKAATNDKKIRSQNGDAWVSGSLQMQLIPKQPLQDRVMTQRQQQRQRCVRVQPRKYAAQRRLLVNSVSNAQSSLQIRQQSTQRRVVASPQWSGNSVGEKCHSTGFDNQRASKIERKVGLSAEKNFDAFEKGEYEIMCKASVRRAFVERQRKRQLEAQEQRTLRRYADNPFLADVTSRPREFHSPSTRVSKIVAASAGKNQPLRQQRFLAEKSAVGGEIEGGKISSRSSQENGEGEAMENRVKTLDAVMDTPPRESSFVSTDFADAPTNASMEVAPRTDVIITEIDPRESSIFSPDLLEGMNFPDFSPSSPSLAPTSSPSGIEADYLLLLRERAIHGFAAERELSRIFREITEEMDNFLTSIQTAKSEMSEEEARRASGIWGEEAGRAEKTAYRPGSEPDLYRDGAPTETREIEANRPMMNADAENFVDRGEAKKESSELGSGPEPVKRESLESEGVLKIRTEKMYEADIEPSVDGPNSVDKSAVKAMNPKEDLARNVGENVVSSEFDGLVRAEEDAKRASSPQYQLDPTTKAKVISTLNDETAVVPQKSRREWTPQELEEELKSKIIVRVPKRKAFSQASSFYESTSAPVVNNGSPALSSRVSTSASAVEDVNRTRTFIEAPFIENGALKGRVSEEKPEVGGKNANSIAFGEDDPDRLVSNNSDRFGHAVVSESSNVWKIFAYQLSASLRYQMGKKKNEYGMAGLEGSRGGRTGGAGSKSFYEDEVVSLANVNRNSEAKDLTRENPSTVEGEFLWLRLFKNLVNADGSWNVGQPNANFAFLDANVTHNNTIGTYAANATNDVNADPEAGNLWLLMAKNMVKRK